MVATMHRGSCCWCCIFFCICRMFKAIIFPKNWALRPLDVAWKSHAECYVSLHLLSVLNRPCFRVMRTIDDRSLVGEGPSEPSSSTKQHITLHSVPSLSMSMHTYFYPPPASLPTQQPVKAKRCQVKNACTNCQKACKKCDDARPCLRCVKYGISEGCADSQRKERQKGVKRGPYKKREGKGASFFKSASPFIHHGRVEWLPYLKSLDIAQAGASNTATYHPHRTCPHRACLF